MIKNVERKTAGLEYWNSHVVYAAGKMWLSMCSFASRCLYHGASGNACAMCRELELEGLREAGRRI